MTEEEFKLFDSLNKENFNINPIYITIAGGIKEGFFLTQLLYHARHNDYQPFCKLDDYFKEKYKFTKWDLTEGRKKLITLGILTTEKRPDGVLSYEIHVDKLIKMLKESTASSGKPTTPHRENRPPLIGKTDVPLFNDRVNDLITTTLRVVELELLMRNGERVSQPKIDFWISVLEEKKVANITDVLKRLWKKTSLEARDSEIGLMGVLVENYSPSQEKGPSSRYKTPEETLAEQKPVVKAEKIPENALIELVAFKNRFKVNKDKK